MRIFLLAGLTAVAAACSFRAGESGASALAFTTNYQGPNCPAGGLAIKTGVDANHNGVLDDNEITQTSYLCSEVRIRRPRSSTSSSRWTVQGRVSTPTHFKGGHYRP